MLKNLGSCWRGGLQPPGSCEKRATIRNVRMTRANQSPCRLSMRPSCEAGNILLMLVTFAASADKSNPPNRTSGRGGHGAGEGRRRQLAVGRVHGPSSTQTTGRFANTWSGTVAVLKGLLDGRTSAGRRFSPTQLRYHRLFANGCQWKRAFGVRSRDSGGTWSGDTFLERI